MIIKYNYNYNYNKLNIKHRIIIILILILFILLLNKNNNNNSKNKISICICTIGKKENKYIREYVDYYRKYGVDKIFLSDNNDINDERFDNILSDYIKLNFVEIYNFRGFKAKQHKIYQNCYNKNNKKYNWLIFYDIDEFIYLNNYTNIKQFLNKENFKKCHSIYLNWAYHTDNNLKYYDNRTLNERFPEINYNKNICVGKSIIRGNIAKIRIKNAHILDNRIIICNGFGNIIRIRKIRYCNLTDYKYYYIDHYKYKSTEEFINKINRGSVSSGDNIRHKYHRIYDYFIYNTITMEKINFIAQKTGLNISIIKKKLNFF